MSNTSIQSLRKDASSKIEKLQKDRLRRSRNIQIALLVTVGFILLITLLNNSINANRETPLFFNVLIVGTPLAGLIIYSIYSSTIYETVIQFDYANDDFKEILAKIRERLSGESWIDETPDDTIILILSEKIHYLQEQGSNFAYIDSPVLDVANIYNEAKRIRTRTEINTQEYASFLSRKYLLNLNDEDLIQIEKLLLVEKILYVDNVLGKANF